MEKKLEELSPKAESLKSKKQKAENDISLIESELSSLRKEAEEIRLAKLNFEKEINSNKNALKEIEEKLSLLQAKLENKRKTEKEIEELKSLELQKNIKKIEEIVQDKNSFLDSLKGKRDSIISAIERISKVDSQCPTCERPIDKESKAKALSLRKEEEQKLSVEIDKAKKELEGLKAQLEKFREHEKKLNLLMLESAKSGYLEEESKDLEKKRKLLKKIIDETAAKDFSEKEREIYSRIAFLEGQKEDLFNELFATEKSETMSEINRLVSAIKETGRRKVQKETELGKNNSEIKLISVKIKELQDESKLISAEIDANHDSLRALFEEKEKALKELSKLEAEMEKSRKSNKLLEEEKERVSKKLSKLSEKMDAVSSKIESKEKELNEIIIEMSKNEVRLNDLEEEFVTFKEAQLLSFINLNLLRKRVIEIESELEKIGPVNMRSLENFEQLKKEVEEIRQKISTLEEERNSVLSMISQIDQRKLTVFNDCFSKVSKKFSELYYNFFNGEGLLELTNTQDPLEGGLLIQAKYKEDTMKSIDAMSGGEKSLTALAFIFSIHSFSPAPFYILDEVDAALDKTNSVKVGAMVKSQSKSSQFIVISHNDSVINQADQIIGVALNKKNSSVIGLKLRSQENVEAYS